jgi:putative pyruvate formate lyase activating enzyme
MYRQCGKNVIDNETGMMKKGIIIRHLILPNYIENSKRVLWWIKENMPDVLVSVMAQYFPSHKAVGMNDIGRKLTEDEYKDIENYVFELDLDGFMQDLEDDETRYVPDFENA